MKQHEKIKKKGYKFGFKHTLCINISLLKNTIGGRHLHKVFKFRWYKIVLFSNMVMMGSREKISEKHSTYVVKCCYRQVCIFFLQHFQIRKPKVLMLHGMFQEQSLQELLLYFIYRQWFTCQYDSTFIKKKDKNPWSILFLFGFCFKRRKVQNREYHLNRSF